MLKPLLTSAFIVDIEDIFEFFGDLWIICTSPSDEKAELITHQGCSITLFHKPIKVCIFFAIKALKSCHNIIHI